MIFTHHFHNLKKTFHFLCTPSLSTRVGVFIQKKVFQVDKLIKNVKKKIDKLMESLVKKDVERDKKIKKHDKKIIKKEK